MSATRTVGRRGRLVDSEPHGRLDALQRDPYPHYERARRTDGTRPEPGTQPVRVVAAVINPAGPSPEQESVTLLNASPAPVDLAGWRIVDRMGQSSPTPSGPLAAGACLRVPLGGGAQLGNHGGEITLLDANGLKVHGVSYTAEQAGREGWSVVF